MITPHTEIIVRTGGAEVLRKTVPPGDYVIGRAAGCDVQVEAGQVAPRHAQLTINYDHAFIDDLGSGSGTFVNGQRVTASTRLWPNQRIQLGNATVTLRRKRAAGDSDESLAPQVAAVRQLLPDELLHDAKYEIGGQIAQGGMGAILNAKEVAIRREVAMKVMLGAGEREDLRRFIEEAQITGQLEHPNIVPVHELNVDENDQVFYTMKLVRGVTLRKVFELLAAGDEAAVERYPLSALLTIFQKVCDALAFAHSRGVIHRDLKPENIMLGDYGEVLVMDWGLAKTLGGRRSVGAPSSPESVGADKAAPSSVDDPAAPSQTLAGTIMGTPQYMAPEQARGDIEALDARSDIYALGAILYHALTLCPPIDATTIDDILAKVRAGEVIPPIERQPPPRPRRAPASPADNLPAPLTPIDLNAPTILQTQAEQPVVGQAPRLPPTPRSAGGAPALHHLADGRVPDSLNAVVLKAMALEQAARYQHVAELQADITAYQNGFATRAENAGFGKQLVLLVKRHRGAFATAAAAWFIITALAVWFVINITRERNRATANEQKATRNAEIAAANAREAKQNAEVAQTNEKRAVASEQEAVAEKENVRRALAKSALALAEAAYREADGAAMQSALDRVPADLRDANWSYLLEQSDTSIARVTIPDYRITGAAAHPTQPGVFAVVGDGRRVTFLEARTGRKLFSFEVDLGKVAASGGVCLAFSPDGERIAVGKKVPNDDARGHIAIHRARDGAPLVAWESTPVTSLEFSPDGRSLLQSKLNRGHHANLWDAESGRLVWTYQSESVNALRARFIPSGRQVLVVIGASQPVLLNVADGLVARTVPATVEAPDALVVRPDGLAAIFGTRSGHVQSVDLREGRILFSTRAHTGPVQHAAFTPNGAQFVSLATLGDGRQSIVISNAATGEPLQRLIGGSTDVQTVAIHPLSGELLVGCQESRLWEINATPPQWALPITSAGSAVGAAAFLGSEDLFLGPAKGFRAALIELRGPTTLWTSASGAHRTVSVSAEGRFVALANTRQAGSSIQFARRGEDKLGTVREFSPGAGILTAFCLSPSGERLALVLGGREKQASVIDPATGSLVVALDRTALHAVHDLQWIDGGSLIGVAIANRPRRVPGSEERVIVWDAASGRQLRSVVHPTALDCLVVAPDGKRFAAAGVDKLVHVFDTETLAVRQAFRAHDGPITALAWHPSRPIVATGSADLTIKLWNIESGRRLETLRGPTAAPRVLNFSPSGQRLACASEDRMVRIWEPKPLNNAVLDAPSTDGWEDLLAKLKADEVKANGNGWTLTGGVLVSPRSEHASVPIGGSLARSSYKLRLSVRSLRQKDLFAVLLPVGDQQVGFILDGYRTAGFATGLSMIDNQGADEHVSAVRGQQVQDAEPHNLEIVVRLGARTVQIAASIDDKPLYEWSGASTSLNRTKHWPSLPQPNLHLGASSADWVVSAVKVKRLEAGK